MGKGKKLGGVLNKIDKMIFLGHPNGQCRCTSSGEVMCDDIKAAPYFMMAYREGKRLTLKMSGGFNVDSLRDTAGFDRVMIIGLSLDQCSRVTETYPSIMCATTTTTMSRHFTTMAGPPLTRPAVTETRPAAGSDSLDQRPAPPFRTTVNGMLIWIVVSGAIGAILTACILVSLVNLHARINTHASCNDPPMFCRQLLLNMHGGDLISLPLVRENLQVYILLFAFTG